MVEAYHMADAVRCADDELRETRADERGHLLAEETAWIRNRLRCFLVANTIKLVF